MKIKLSDKAKIELLKSIAVGEIDLETLEAIDPQFSTIVETYHEKAGKENELKISLKDIEEWNKQRSL